MFLSLSLALGLCCLSFCIGQFIFGDDISYALLISAGVGGLTVFIALFFVKTKCWVVLAQDYGEFTLDEEKRIFCFNNLTSYAIGKTDFSLKQKMQGVFL